MFIDHRSNGGTTSTRMTDHESNDYHDFKNKIDWLCHFGRYLKSDLLALERRNKVKLDLKGQ